MAGRGAYYYLKSTRIAYLLARAEAKLRSDKSELGGAEVIANRSLTVEHLMPQAWENHWPLPDGASEEEVRRRKDLVNYFGNLTILTQKLNSDISNGPWGTKRMQLNKHSVLLMNSHLSGLEVWDEKAIEDRSQALTETFCSIWPR